MKSSKLQIAKERLARAISKQINHLEIQMLDWQKIAFGAFDPKIPVSTLLMALEINHKELNLRATDWLTRHWATAPGTPLIPHQDTIAVVGSLNSSKMALRKKLKTVGIGYAAKINEEVSHLVVGHKIKAEELQYLLAHQQKYVYLSESMLIDFLQAQQTSYLAHADHQQIAHVSSLLLHQDNNNIALAFELLETGGVPKALLTELFIVYKFCKEDSLQRKAQKLLNIHGDSSLKLLLKKLKKEWWSVSYDDWLREAGLEAWKIYQYEYLYRGLQPSLFQKALDTTPTAAIETFLSEVLQAWSHGNYQEILYLPADFDLQNYAQIVYQCKHLKELYIAAGYSKRIHCLPKGIQQLHKLEALKIQTALNEFPEELQELPHLQHLSINMASIKDHQSLFETGFQQLSVLELSYYRYKELPPHIGNLSHLKTLDIGGGDIERLPASLRQLKKLEYLNLYNNKFDEIPDILFLMPQLKLLNLGGYWSRFSSSDIATLQSALPNCEIRT